MESGESGGLFERMLGGGDHQKRADNVQMAPQAPAGALHTWITRHIASAGAWGAFAPLSALF